MEHWKLPELRPLAGYELHCAENQNGQLSAGISHCHVPNLVPNSSGQSGANRTAKASRSMANAPFNASERIGELFIDFNRLAKLKINHLNIKSRLNARLEDIESKNRRLVRRRDYLKEYQEILDSVRVVKERVAAAEHRNRQLKAEVKAVGDAVRGFDMEGLLEEVDAEEERRESEEDDECVDDDDGSEEEEAEATDYSEEDAESICSEDEDNYTLT